MRNPVLFLFGLMVILLGFVFLFDNAVGFNLFRLLWPIGLIVAGISLILQRNKKSTSYGVSKQNQAFICEVKRNGRWPVENESFSAFIADMLLDLSDADIPKGETVYDISGFIGDVKIRVPEDVAVMVSSSSFIGETNVLGKKEAGVFGPTSLRSDDYDTAVRKIRIEASYFISDIKVTTSGYPTAEMIKEKSPSLLS